MRCGAGGGKSKGARRAEGRIDAGGGGGAGSKATSSSYACAEDQVSW